MTDIKKLYLSLLLITSITSCGPSDVIVNIYGVSEYNCSTGEYRILKPIPMLSFLKPKKWYTREEFHEANYKDALKPYKDLAMSEDTLSKFLPTIELSNGIYDDTTQYKVTDNIK